MNSSWCCGKFHTMRRPPGYKFRDRFVSKRMKKRTEEKAGGRKSGREEKWERRVSSPAFHPACQLFIPPAFLAGRSKLRGRLGASLIINGGNFWCKYNGRKRQEKCLIYKSSILSFFVFVNPAIVC